MRIRFSPLFSIVFVLFAVAVAAFTVTKAAATCTSHWSCAYGICLNSWHTQTCTDTNNCSPPTNVPRTASGSCACHASWHYSNWGPCNNVHSGTGSQVRTAVDRNASKCSPSTGTGALSRSCTCTPKWTCGGWSACVIGSSTATKTRTCTDSNNCDTSKNKPITSTSCTCS